MIVMRKITVEVPEDLLVSVQAGAGTGVSETVRQALELMRQRQALLGLRALRGKVRFGVDPMELRRQED
jgi:Arc/MetJ-type ribon-helix-helix transcriptional regulator